MDFSPLLTPDKQHLTFTTLLFSSPILLSYPRLKLINMPIRGYGVWKGFNLKFDINDARTDPESPHGHIKFEDDSGDEIDSAINVKSSSHVTEVVYWKYRAPNFFPASHPIIKKLEALTENRFYAKEENPGLHIDFLRDGLFRLEDGRIPPWNTPGIPNDDMIDFLSDFVQNGDRKNANIYIFGQEYTGGDKGIHQIHMVQGTFYERRNRRWYEENGINQDGGIFLRFPDGTWEAFFIAFAGQASRTDNNGNPAGISLLDFHGGGGGGEPGGGTGRPTSPVVRPSPPPPGLSVRIQSALVNPKGSDNNPQLEMIKIENNGSEEVSLAGWFFENQTATTQRLPNGAALAAGGEAEFPAGDCYLTNNRDGTITLKDADSQVVDIVGYRKSEAAQEGRWITFHEGDTIQGQGFNLDL